MNGAIAKPHPNIYKLIDIIKEQEQLGAINFEKANLGTKKSRRTKEELKDAQIECLKLKYEISQLFSIFVGKFCPPGSGSGFQPRIQIH